MKAKVFAGLLIALLLCGFLVKPASAEGSTVHLRQLYDEDFRPEAATFRESEEYQIALSLLTNGGIMEVEGLSEAKEIVKELRISKGIHADFNKVLKGNLDSDSYPRVFITRNPS